MSSIGAGPYDGYPSRSWANRHPTTQRSDRWSSADCRRLPASAVPVLRVLPQWCWWGRERRLDSGPTPCSCP